MPIKRYSSPCVKFTINVKIDGKMTGIVFDRYNHDDKRRYADISDSCIQEQMEKSSDFNVYFRLDFSISDPDAEIENIIEAPAKIVVAEAKKEEVNPLKEVKIFSAIIKAKEWINKNHGVAYSKIVNLERLVSEYSKIGFDLKISTIKK